MAEERVELSRPKAPVSKTGVASNYTTRPNLVSADGFEPPWPQGTAGLQPARFSRSRTHSCSRTQLAPNGVILTYFRATNLSILRPYDDQ